MLAEVGSEGAELEWARRGRGRGGESAGSIAGDDRDDGRREPGRGTGVGEDQPIEELARGGGDEVVSGGRTEPCEEGGRDGSEASEAEAPSRREGLPRPPPLEPDARNRG